MLPSVFYYSFLSYSLIEEKEIKRKQNSLKLLKDERRRRKENFLNKEKKMFKKEI